MAAQAATVAKGETTVDEALRRTERLAGLGTLTASIAHELTNPLSIITATSANLRHLATEGELSPSQLLQYVDIIERSAWRGVRLIEALQGYSHPESQRAGLLRLESIIEATLTLVDHTLDGREQIWIERAVEPDLPPLPGDHNQLVQVLLNLLLNAQDALRERGGRIEVSAWSEDERQVIRVRDDGPGLGPEVLPHVFEPFFTTKPRGEGTGLGLAVAHEIVTVHGGRLTAANHSDGGAMFTIYLPAEEAN